MLPVLVVCDQEIEVAAPVEVVEEAESKAIVAGAALSTVTFRVAVVVLPVESRQTAESVWLALEAVVESHVMLNGSERSRRPA